MTTVFAQSSRLHITMPITAGDTSHLFPGLYNQIELYVQTSDAHHAPWAFHEDFLHPCRPCRRYKSSWSWEKLNIAHALQQKCRYMCNVRRRGGYIMHRFAQTSNAMLHDPQKWRKISRSYANCTPCYAPCPSKKSLVIAPLRNCTRQILCQACWRPHLTSPSVGNDDKYGMHTAPSRRWV